MVCLNCGKKCRHSTLQGCWVHQKSGKVSCAKASGICRPVTQAGYDRRPATSDELQSLTELTTRGVRC